MNAFQFFFLQYGRSRSKAAPMMNTPQTPAGVAPTSMGSMGNLSTEPLVAAAARNEPQPPMVLLVADEAGARRRVAVSPTRHLSSNNLTQSYRSLGWGVYITPAAITGVCQMSSYPSKLGVLHPKASGMVPFVTAAAT